MLSRISLFMQRRKIVQYTESTGECFLTDYLTKKPYSIPYQQAVKTTLRWLNELNNGDNYKLIKQTAEAPPPPQFAELLEAYMKFCASTGNKEPTIAIKRKFCTDFLCRIYDAGCKNVCDTSTEYICKAILRISNKDSYAVIRSFLRYLYGNGTLSNDLSGIIPKYRRHIALPTTYTDDEIRRLEGVINSMQGQMLKIIICSSKRKPLLKKFQLL